MHDDEASFKHSFLLARAVAHLFAAVAVCSATNSNTRLL